MTKNTSRATHTGTLKIGDLKIPCAVLDDGRRVLTEHGITTALGSRSGSSKRAKKAAQTGQTPLPVFVASKNIYPFISEELMSGLINPVEFLDGKRVRLGFLADLLPQICDVWLSARDAGAINKQQIGRIQKAEILMRGLAHVGIIALVDEATGYQEVRAKDELHKILDAFVAKELLPWAKRFPDEFYKELFRLHGWKYIPFSVKRPKYVGKLTNSLIYDRLPLGVKDELQKKNPVVSKETWRRKYTHHQHLTQEIGHPFLDKLLAGTIALMRAANNWTQFKRMFERSYPKPDVTQLELPGLGLEDE